MIYTIQNPYKMGIYHNTSRKTIAQIKAELGADIICNLNLFDMSKFTGNCFTKADGKIVGNDGAVYPVLAWNANDKIMKQSWSNSVASYSFAFGCLDLVKNGKYTNNVPSWASGLRQRTAVGIKADGTPVIYCNQANIDIKTVADALIGQGCVYAINVDGGGSTQCITPVGTITSSRIVHTLFYAILEKPKTSTAPNSTKETCPYKEPTINISRGSRGEGAKWFQWFLDKLGYDIGASGVDGDFGSKSSSALIAFQKDAKLTADGIGGKLSRAALIEAYNKKFYTSQPTSSQPIKDTTPTAKTEYTVKFGDSWWGIAEKMLGSGSKMYDLAKANGKTINSSLKVGDKIYLPIENEAATTPSISTSTPDKVKMMVDYAYAQIGSPYVYGSQGEDAGDKIVDWSARCFPDYTTQTRANRIKKYIKDHPTLNGKPVKVFDCSSLVLCACEAAGLRFADTTAAGIYYNLATPVKKSELMPGDVVLTEKLDHIGIVGYDGEIVEAAGSDIGVVKTSSVDNRTVKSIYGESYGTYTYYSKNPWTKFARIKGLR